MKHTLKPMPPAWRRTSKVFTALGDEYRQRILLSFEPDGSLTLGEIVAMSSLSRTAVAHHVRVLREAGILVSRKQGKAVHLKIDRAFLQDSLQTVLDYVRDQAGPA
jgi:DNA-binding transcriptional ArsR family regulator